MSQTHNFQPLAPIQFIDQVDVAPHTYSGQAFNVYRVNAGEDGLQPIAISTMTGSGATNEIATFTGAPIPVLQDSGMSIYNTTIPIPPDPLPLQVRVLDLNPVTPLDNALAHLFDPNSGKSGIFLGAGASSGASELLIGNNSSNPNHDFLLFNNSPGGMINMGSDVLSLNILSNSGNNGDLLTADGTGSCTWQAPAVPISQNVCMASINNVPAGAAWVAYSGFVPYNDAGLGYSGFQLQNGSSVSYNNATHLFTIVDAGIYNVMVVQNIDIDNSLGFVKSDGRLMLATSPGIIQINQDSGRFETTAAMSAAGILSLNYQLNVVANLLPGDYGIFMTGETEGGLLGKASCVWTRVT